MRSKPFLTYFLICAVPLLLLAALNYWNGTRSVDTTVSRVVQNDLNSFVVNVDDTLREHESVLLKLVLTPEIQGFQKDASLRGKAESNLQSVLALTGGFRSLALFDRNRQPVWFAPREAPRVISQPDDRVWTLQGNVSVDRVVDDGAGKRLFLYAVPIHDPNGVGNEGALVATIDLQQTFAKLA